MKKLLGVCLLTMGFIMFTDQSQSQNCGPGGSWDCVPVAIYAGGQCAYYQGSACLWCDCFKQQQ